MFDFLAPALQLAHPSWHPAILAGLQAIHEADPHYLPELAKRPWLPTENRIFAAFAQPQDQVRYVLVGEGPYPREKSATGVCFMDGAVEGLWSDQADGGLSKTVNRATSLRNFIKMLAVASGDLDVAQTAGSAMAELAQRARSAPGQWIQTLAQLQHNLTRNGFLLLNATLVFRPDVAPVKDGRAWQPFLQQILAHLHRAHAANPPTLVLWGKIAAQLDALPELAGFPKAVSEHPYNLSFIGNPVMQQLFARFALLNQPGMIQL
jgi:uracil-DNA glycosylase